MSRPEVNVRAATTADVAAVLPLVKKICEMHRGLDPQRFAFVPDIADRYATWLPQRATDQRSVFNVGEVDGVIVAYLVGTIEPAVPIYWVREHAWIHDLWVEPEYRGHGTARRLVAAAVERFRAIGVAQIKLETAFANEAAREVFAACGFRRSTVEMLLPLRDVPQSQR